MKLLFIQKWKARRIERKVDELLQRTETMMASLEETLANTTAMSGRIDSLQALFEGVKAQLDEVLTGVVIPPLVQAKIDAIFDVSAANLADIDTSLNTNVPLPEPVPPPEPAPEPTP